MRLVWGVILLFLASSWLSGCEGTSDFERLVEKELASGATFNELFLGYEFGMTREAFYERSWDLNRQGLVMQGPRNQTVQYELEEELPSSAKMYFYPDFHDEKIFQMRVRFQYDGWAPWNRDLAADRLQLDVVKLFTEWYGDGFIEQVESTDSRGDMPYYVKIDGNRKIAVAMDSDSEVLAVFTDLRVEQEKEEPAKGE